jgi:hypothetical protein
MGKVLLLSDIQKQEVASLYLSGVTSPAIAKQMGISTSFVLLVLQEQGVSRRQGSEAHRRHILDETVFDTITEASAYWVGFLMADGCIYRKEIRLVLSERDLDHLRAFRSFLGSSHTIAAHFRETKSHEILGRTVTIRPSHQLCINSAKLVESLARFGVVPRKSSIARVSHLEDNPHFWRGVVDGDGTLGIYRKITRKTGRKEYEYRKPTIRVVGSSDLMGQFLDFVRGRSPGCKATVRPQPGNYTSAQLFGRFAVDIAVAIYGDCKVALPRKLSIAREIIAL